MSQTKKDIVVYSKKKHAERKRTFWKLYKEWSPEEAIKYLKRELLKIKNL